MQRCRIYLLTQYSTDKRNGNRFFFFSVGSQTIGVPNSNNITEVKVKLNIISIQLVIWIGICYW